ncbi:MAG: glycosyltransferase [Pseudothermotoga sp.]
MFIDIVFFLLTAVISLISISTRSKRMLQFHESGAQKNYRISIVIPARNEEQNIGKILTLLRKQSILPNEIIVVNDNSSDKTSEIAKGFENIKVVDLKEDPPKGWVGKSWAIWNGFQHSTGEILIFMDADVEPGENAVQALIEQFEKQGGLLSVWPYQRFERFYEHFTAVFNILVIYGSNTLGFPYKTPSGAFGPVILTSRKDYEYTGGHQAIRDSVLEDIKLAKLYIKRGIKVSNFLGNGIIKFRMYPAGFKQLFQGFSKNMSSGATTGGPLTFLLFLLWMAGYYSSFSSFDLSLAYTAFRYIGLSLFFYLLLKPTGDYRWYDALLYPLHFLFFIVVFLYSLYQTVVLKKVNWKGRKIDV